MRILIVLIACTYSIAACADEAFSTTYGNLVDDAGNITLPDNFRTDWAFLGTWSIAAEDVERSGEASGHGAAGLHNVYTQRGVAEYFRENGSFPDGAVIVKELLKAVTDSMTTGTVSRGNEVEGWFIMIKDTEARYGSNPLWGDGWGWVLFNVDEPDKPVTTNYKTECVGCHIPARKDDWIYLSGYPVLAE
ncbi:MAG: cytochrome P460 family protein [Gammaproteobacteria bacterium]|nr:cytochrome P460 family protein [Gammaproteobacteria bacterium]